MIDYGARYQHLLSSCRTLVQQVRLCSERACCVSTQGMIAAAAPVCFVCPYDPCMHARAWHALFIHSMPACPHTCPHARSRAARTRRWSRACWRAPPVPARRRWRPRWPLRAASLSSRSACALSCCSERLRQQGGWGAVVGRGSQGTLSLAQAPGHAGMHLQRGGANEVFVDCLPTPCRLSARRRWWATASRPSAARSPRCSTMLTRWAL